MPVRIKYMDISDIHVSYAHDHSRTCMRLRGNWVFAEREKFRLVVNVRCLRGSASLFERPLSPAQSVFCNGCSSTWRNPSPPSPLEVHYILVERYMRQGGLILAADRVCSKKKNEKKEREIPPHPNHTHSKMQFLSSRNPLWTFKGRSYT